MKPIEEIYRPFPDEAREARPPAPPPPARRPLATLVRVVLFGATLFLLGVAMSAIHLRECARAQERERVRLEVRSYLTLQKVKQALEEHRRRTGALPSGVSEPLTPLHRPIHYRAPGLHNPDGFDLWTEDRHGNPAGLRNWDE